MDYIDQILSEIRNQEEWEEDVEETEEGGMEEEGLEEDEGGMEEEFGEEEEEEF